MNVGSNSVGNNHLVDINEVLHEEEEDHNEENSNISTIADKPDTRFNRPTKNREIKRPPRKFSRQVSLETGFSVLNGETSKDKNERKILGRSGKSFGGFGVNGTTGIEARNKGDFNMFRTKSTIARQSSKIPLRKESGIELQNNNVKEGLNDHVKKSVPAGRYFDALTGPELDQVKDSEDILLPKDEKWPFLLRFPIGCFGICLGLSSQAILWRSLALSPVTKFLHVPLFINFAVWLLAVGVLVAVFITYMFKCALYFEAIKREYFHPVRVNFFCAPWIVCMFLAIGAPPKIAPGTLHPAIWCVFMAPIFFLNLKIYGQWLSGGKRRLCKVANPSSHLSVIGNFVGAILAAKVGWKEPGKFLWSIGFAHYLVVFVTLYQRLPTSEALPKELHPVYSMFIATPAAASLAWGAIYDEFDGLARTCYFISLFLYLSLVVRPNFFTGFKFSVAWWSYTFPMTTVSIATIKYAEEVPSFITKALALALSFMSTTMVCILFVSTLLHAFVWKTLFPNDLAIAITKKRYSKDKKPLMKRWAKHSPLSFVTSIGKHNSGDKECASEEEK
ncbi:hypothetical protein KY290_034782 [Solanum tuberosum]|uniref:Tellurite resistance protein tehA n=1 Tax=Solanum tuberosum TaxID=4113 RepID=A0ABQ7U670_SOLTU|nr:hypothetical protein KY289_034151 [Solanum tuberosum]KAH0648763.1 hypothetical protein KY285_034011 [Solanum tuberosum]KAH0741739.1 hypothetical protein KY290_034782 [Solanum tuberosum]